MSDPKRQDDRVSKLKHDYITAFKPTAYIWGNHKNRKDALFIADLWERLTKSADINPPQSPQS